MLSARKRRESQINLLPQEEFAASTMGRILKWLLSTFRYLVITTEMIVIVAFLSRFWFDSINADLNDEISQKQDYVEAYASFEEEFRGLQSKIDIYKATTKNQAVASQVTQGVASKLPSDIRLVKVNILEDNSLQVTGSSLSEQSIEQLVVNLTDDEAFSDVGLQNVESKANTPFLNFTINMQLKEKLR